MLSMAAATAKHPDQHFTLKHLDKGGNTLSQTSSRVAALGSHKNYAALLPLRYSHENQWTIRIDLTEEDQMLHYVIYSAALTPEGSINQKSKILPTHFDSRQKWQGPGIYTLCTIMGNRVVVEITNKPDNKLEQIISPHRISLTNKRADGSVIGECSTPWVPSDEDERIWLALPTRDANVHRTVIFGTSQIDEIDLSTLQIYFPKNLQEEHIYLNHSLTLDLNKADEVYTACEQDGEKIEIQLIGGKTP